MIVETAVSLLVWMLLINVIKESSRVENGRYISIVGKTSTVSIFESDFLFVNRFVFEALNYATVECNKSIN